MDRIHPLKFLTLLLLLLFVWSCAAPPAPVKKPAKSEKELKKPQKVQKKKAVKKKKRVVRKAVKPKPKPQPEPKSVPELPEVQVGVPVTAGEADIADDHNTTEPGKVVYGRMMFHYDYYPDSEVYFDTIRHLYFYREKGKWVMSVALPTSYRTDGESFRLKLKTGQPYTLHKEHRRLYPASGR